MKKRIITIVLVLAVIFTSVQVSVAFALDNTKAAFTVTADKTTAVAGDEINFTVKADLINPMTAFEFTLVIPEGLTLVAGSVSAIAKEDIGFDGMNNNEEALLVSGYGSHAYTAESTLTLAQFKCTVDDGVSGKYTVTLTDTVLNDDDFEEESHDVFGAEIEVVIPVTGISLNKDSLVLNDDGSEQLIANVTPDNATNKSVIWTSGDTTVATVAADGTVTAVRFGTTTITAETADGGFSAVCSLTVNCTHKNTTKHNAKNSTCLEQGNAEYYTCDACGVVTSGSDAKLPLAGHTGGTATCLDKAICDVCKQAYGDYADHDLTEHSASEPDHFNEGNIQYWTCDVCGKFFSDEKGETEIDEEDTVLPVVPHEYPDDWSKDAAQHWKECGCGNKVELADHIYDNACDTTCNVCGQERTITHAYSDVWSTDGTQHWHECTVCHNKTDIENHAGGEATCLDKAICDVCKQAYGDYAEHVFAEQVDDDNLVSEATCVAKAVYYKKCSVCGALSTETFTFGDVDSDNHFGGEATCVKKAVCDGCQVEYGEIDPDNHANTVTVNDKPATCYEEGYTGDVYCEDCKQIVENGTAIQMSEHTASEWLSDDAEHWKVCTIEKCGAEIESSRAAHTESEWIVDSTDEKTGVVTQHIECTVCKKVLKTETVIKPVQFEIADGADAAWTKGEGEDLTFKCNTAVADITEIKIDGKKIDAANYDVGTDSLSITLKKAFIETLAEGKHTITIVTANGYAETSFEVKAAAKAAEEENNSIQVVPDTGDAIDVVLWLIVFVTSLGVCVTVTVVSKKRKVR